MKIRTTFFFSAIVGLGLYGSLPVRADSLPVPWRSRDIGSIGVPGLALYSQGVFTVSASGDDIFGKADSFRYVYQPLKGDGEIVARVVSYVRQDTWTKVGLMVRETLAPDAAFADILVTPDKGAEFQHRNAPGGDTQTSDQTPSPTPIWIKLVRAGDTLTGFLSTDGKTWQERGHDTIKMADSVWVGLCVTSHKNDALTQAQIDSVTLTLPKPGSVVRIESH